MSFALAIAGHGSGIRLRTQWEDPAPIGEREFLENLILKKRLGVSTRQLLLESGYGDHDVSEMLLSEPPIKKKEKTNERRTTTPTAKISR